MKDRTVMIFLMVFVTLLLLVLFFGVTIAGGRAHTRANEEAARKLAVRQAAALSAETKRASDPENASFWS